MVESPPTTRTIFINGFLQSHDDLSQKAGPDSLFHDYYLSFPHPKEDHMKWNHCRLISIRPSPSPTVTMTLDLIDMTSVRSNVMATIDLGDMWRSHAQHAFKLFSQCQIFEHVHCIILPCRYEKEPPSFKSSSRIGPQCRGLRRAALQIRVLFSTNPINDRKLIERAVSFHCISQIFRSCHLSVHY